MNCVSANTFDRYLFNKEETEDPSTCTDETTLHVFVDASMAAYGAAVYISKNNMSALVMSKSRVAPLKGLTLPRLELMAAVIGARLSRHVQKEVTVTKVELWSDSQIVLHWLQTKRTLQRGWTGGRGYGGGGCGIGDGGCGIGGGGGGKRG